MKYILHKTLNITYKGYLNIQSYACKLSSLVLLYHDGLTKRVQYMLLKLRNPPVVVICLNTSAFYPLHTFNKLMNQ